MLGCEPSAHYRRQKYTLYIPPSPRASTTRLHPHHKQMPESSASQSTAHLLGERPPPLTDEEAKAVLFRQFRGWTFTERQGAHRHWSWQYGWDISKGVERKFACKVCVSDRKRTIEAFAFSGLQNAHNHLFEDVKGSSTRGLFN